jgi:hypothetical protein
MTFLKLGCRKQFTKYYSLSIAVFIIWLILFFNTVCSWQKSWLSSWSNQCLMLICYREAWNEVKQHLIACQRCVLLNALDCCNNSTNFVQICYCTHIIKPDVSWRKGRIYHFLSWCGKNLVFSKWKKNEPRNLKLNHLNMFKIYLFTLSIARVFCKAHFFPLKSSKYVKYSITPAFLKIIIFNFFNL